jgi:hypothetical protein
MKTHLVQLQNPAAQEALHTLCLHRLVISELMFS